MLYIRTIRHATTATKAFRECYRAACLGVRRPADWYCPWAPVIPLAKSGNLAPASHEDEPRIDVWDDHEVVIRAPHETSAYSYPSTLGKPLAFSILMGSALFATVENHPRRCEGPSSCLVNPRRATSDGRRPSGAYLFSAAEQIPTPRVGPKHLDRPYSEAPSASSIWASASLLHNSL